MDDRIIGDSGAIIKSKVDTRQSQAAVTDGGNLEAGVIEVEDIIV